MGEFSPFQRKGNDPYSGPTKSAETGIVTILGNTCRVFGI
jgi:hypothetical protein